MPDSQSLQILGAFRALIGRPRERVFPITKARTTRTAGLYMEHSFFEQAEALRMQYDWRLAAAGRKLAENPLKYASIDNAYRYWVATADQVFGQEALLNFLDRLRGWAKEKLGLKENYII